MLRRGVPREEEGSYLPLWNELAERMREAGGHAWHFCQAVNPSIRAEFLEFPAREEIPRLPAPAAAALAALDRAIPRTDGETHLQPWIEERHET